MKWHEVTSTQGPDGTCFSRYLELLRETRSSFLRKATATWAGSQANPTAHFGEFKDGMVQSMNFSWWPCYLFASVFWTKLVIICDRQGKLWDGGYDQICLESTSLDTAQKDRPNSMIE